MNIQNLKIGDKVAIRQTDGRLSRAHGKRGTIIAISLITDEALIVFNNYSQGTMPLSTIGKTRKD